MLWLLGILDLIIGFNLIFLKFNFSVEYFAIILAVYLVIKSLIFIKDFTSIVDLIGAIFILSFIFFNFGSVFIWIFVVWFIQKGFFSLFR